MPRRSQSIWGPETPLKEFILLNPQCSTHLGLSHPLVKSIETALGSDVNLRVDEYYKLDGQVRVPFRDIYDLCFKLDHAMRGRFREISFMHWAFYSIGLGTQEITKFQLYVEHLCAYLDGVILKTGIEKNKLELENPFVEAVIKGMKTKDIFQQGIDCITMPLRKFFDTWDPKNKKELQCLELRFNRQHRLDTPDAKPFSKFDTDTSLLSNLRVNLSHLAITRSREDLEEFRRIEEREIKERRILYLGSRWNEYSLVIQDCAVLGGRRRLIRLARRFRYLRNYYSLTAVLSGLRNAGITIPAKMNLFIDSNDEYLAYRSYIDISPALHFVNPLLRISERNSDAREAIMRFQLYADVLEKRGRRIKRCF